jgi:hypothetical protein
VAKPHLHRESLSRERLGIRLSSHAGEGSDEPAQALSGVGVIPRAKRSAHVERLLVKGCRFGPVSLILGELCELVDRECARRVGLHMNLGCNCDALSQQHLSI